uniref:Uncharacterized protein n=1 Tax=viral metagenome TaxID=1070528 RepID=A0A6M3KS48_9ZZZZ
MKEIEFSEPDSSLVPLIEREFKVSSIVEGYFSLADRIADPKTPATVRASLRTSRDLLLEDMTSEHYAEIGT